MNTNGRYQPLPHTLVLAIAFAAFAAGVACAVLLWLWLLPRGCPEVWQWELRRHILPPFPWTVPAAIGLLLAALVSLDAVRTTTPPSKLRCFLLLVALILTCGALMAAMAFDDTRYVFRASAVILGDNSMAYYRPARRNDDIVRWIRDVDTRTNPRRVPARVATHPPGPVVYYWLMQRYLLARPDLLNALKSAMAGLCGDEDLSAATMLARRVATLGPETRDVVIAFWAGFLLTFAAPLVIPVTFGIGTVAGGTRAGIVAALLAATIPALLCFNPSVDTLGIVLAATALLLWLWALRFPGARLPALLCGIIWTIAAFWSFGLLAMASVFAIIGIIAWLDSRLTVGALARQVALVMLSVTVSSLLLFALIGYDPLASAAQSLQVHRSIMQPRPYQLSIVCNLYDFALFAGPTLLIAALAGVVIGMSRQWKPRLVAGIGIAVLLTVILLAVSGQTRGEVGRIWGFLMPALAVPAAMVVLQLKDRGVIYAGLLVAAAQLTFAIAINSNLLLVGP